MRQPSDRRHKPGSHHDEVALALLSHRDIRAVVELAHGYLEQGDYTQAEPLYQKALVIWESQPVPSIAEFLSCLEGYARLLRKTCREGEARI